MEDLRGYSREVVSLVCALYTSKNEEFKGKILNLSESGVLIELDFNEYLYNRDFSKLSIQKSNMH